MNLPSHSFKCGHCGGYVSSKEGFRPGPSTVWQIYICHAFNKPTFFGANDAQIPGAKIGNVVNNVEPNEVNNLFEELEAVLP